MEGEKQTSGYGVINEVGDLGLGFEQLSKQDQEKLNREEKKDK